MTTLTTWGLRLGNAALLVALAVYQPGCGDNVTDCYEMRTAEGTTASGEACTCTFLYPVPPAGGDPVGPPCDQDCRSLVDGREVLDCNAVRPF